MNVLSLPVGLDHVFVAAHSRHKPQFNLRIVGVNEDVIVVLRHKETPQLPSLFRADRDILQIRFGTGKTAGKRKGLLEIGMNAAVFIGNVEKRVGVGAL